MLFVSRTIDFFRTRQLLLGIIGAICIALILTAISLKLYDLDDVSRLDVSLPNRESIRPASTTDDTSKKFDAFGALDSKAYADFSSMYQKDRTTLDKLGKFDDNSLADDSLQISANTQ